MKLVTVAGPPACGKTALIVRTLGHLAADGIRPAVIKFDCLKSRDGELYEEAGIPVSVALSGGLCPDHFFISNLEEAFDWARDTGADCCVIDNLMGIDAPEKIGPMLKNADVVAITKGDLVSQAEREVYRYRIRQMNRRAVIRHVNGLTGQGCMDLAAILAQAPAVDSVTDMKLRFSMPAAICSYCLSETRIGNKYQKGNVKKVKFGDAHGG
jgi:Ni2+-binding GTPase involved in maturation of urease and hydrogenase